MLDMAPFVNDNLVENQLNVGKDLMFILTGSTCFSGFVSHQKA
jgi:hypothetical protein